MASSQRQFGRTPTPLQVHVLFDGYTLKVAPDPVVVRAGTPVQWVFRYTGDQSPPPMRWTVYFDHGTPFAGRRRVFSITAEEPKDAAQEGKTEPEPPLDPGDWKYGVRAEDAKTDVPIADEDPVLRVLP